MFASLVPIEVKIQAISEKEHVSEKQNHSIKDPWYDRLCTCH